MLALVARATEVRPLRCGVHWAASPPVCTRPAMKLMSESTMSTSASVARTNAARCSTLSGRVVRIATRSRSVSSATSRRTRSSSGSSRQSQKVVACGQRSPRNRLPREADATAWLMSSDFPHFSAPLRSVIPTRPGEVTERSRGRSQAVGICRKLPEPGVAAWIGHHQATSVGPQLGPQSAWSVGCHSDGAGSSSKQSAESSKSATTAQLSAASAASSGWPRAAARTRRARSAERAASTGSPTSSPVRAAACSLMRSASASGMGSLRSGPGLTGPPGRQRSTAAGTVTPLPAADPGAPQAPPGLPGDRAPYRPPVR